MTIRSSGEVTPVHPHACGEDGIQVGLPWEQGRFTPTRVGKTLGNTRIPSRMPVHPHACGEDSFEGLFALPRPRFTPTRVGKTRQLTRGVPDAPGSPPRVWGRRSRPDYAEYIRRFTPTRVGKTAGPCTNSRRRIGSPPRVWGRRPGVRVDRLGMRFTPTRVGKTIAAESTATRSTVHPHACGEDRGTAAPGRGLDRFTPTRVGKTCSASQFFRAVYGSPPRVWGRRCGNVSEAGGDDGSPPRVWGRLSSGTVSIGSSGSPPRVWGRLAARIRSGTRERFTPTRVGKTWFPGRYPSARAVHPHACGEDASRSSLISSGVGSPPRVWGRPDVHPLHADFTRFTPTRVGKTGLPEGFLADAPVHPHACGEDAKADHLLARHLRFTPTRVGKTGVRTSVQAHTAGSPPRVWGRLGQRRRPGT